MQNKSVKDGYPLSPTSVTDIIADEVLTPVRVTVLTHAWEHLENSENLSNNLSRGHFTENENNGFSPNSEMNLIQIRFLVHFIFYHPFIMLKHVTMKMKIMKIIME